MRTLKAILLTTSLISLTTPILLAETQLSYDRFESKPKQEQEKNGSLERIIDAPFLPIQFASAGAEKTLNWIENTHLPKKVKWFWQDVLQDNGIYPEARFSPSVFGVGGGGQLELEKLLKFEEKIPFLKIYGRGGATVAGDADFGGGYKLTQSSGPRLYQTGSYNFSHKENENFYGLGPRSSRGEGYSYEINTSQLKTEAGFYPLPALNLGGDFSYRHVTVHNGDVKGAGDFSNYTINDLPGVDGGEIITVGSFIKHDTRDIPDDPTQGGLRRFGWNFNRDTRHGDNYFKYQIELTQYFRLWSERRIFVTRFFNQHVQDVNHSSIPFFDMSRLGGYGIQPSESETLRGYKYNRFFDKSSAVLNLEYRYNVWQYGNWGADWLLFTDIGKVYGELHEFGIGGLRVSYGTGVRFKFNRRVFLSLQLAHSAEGTELYVKTKTPF